MEGTISGAARWPDLRSECESRGVDVEHPVSQDSVLALVADIAGITELSPSWRPMLHAMAMSLPAPYPSHGEGDRKFPGQIVRTVVHLPAAPSLGGPG